MNNSHTSELSNVYINGSHLTLFKTETPEFAVFTVLYVPGNNQPAEHFFFEEKDEAAARKKHKAILKKLVALTT